MELIIKHETKGILHSKIVSGDDHDYKGQDFFESAKNLYPESKVLGIFLKTKSNIKYKDLEKDEVLPNFDQIDVMTILISD